MDNQNSELDNVPEIDGADVELVCWYGWYNSPISGLAVWNDKPYWFECRFAELSDSNDQYQLYELSNEALQESIDWFKEKELWYYNSELVTLRETVADPEKRRLLVQEKGLVLRNWSGPKLPEKPVAVFDKNVHSSFWGYKARDKWHLPSNWTG